MGAELWDCETPWADDPAQALLELQTAILNEHYDIPRLIQKHLEETRVALQWARDNPRYQLVPHTQDELARIEEAATHAIPADPAQRVALVRDLHLESDSRNLYLDALHGVIEIRSVSAHREPGMAQRLDGEEIERLFAKRRPTLEDAKDKGYEISDRLRLGRGEAVCFPFYHSDEGGPPTGWYFVGKTFD